MIHKLKLRNYSFTKLENIAFVLCVPGKKKCTIESGNWPPRTRKSGPQTEIQGPNFSGLSDI